MLGHARRPLEPVKVTREGKKITVAFHVPVGPMVWETEFFDHAARRPWRSGNWGRALRCVSSDGKRSVAIASAEIVGDAVAITVRADDPGPMRV